nr:uncharacterized protein LOC113801107 [Penaeus vannamei]
MALTLSVVLACAGVVLGSVHPPAYGHHPQPAYAHHAPAYGHHAPAYGHKHAYEHAYCDPSYADVADQSADDLVDMITKDQEEAFDYSYYTGASTGDSPYDATHWAGPEGYICPAEVVYAMPKRAQNVEGKWRVIVNDVHYYSQTARLETCLFPEAACRALAPCYQSHCTQKSVYHRLLSYDPCDPYRGLFIDIYKMPSACSCHLPA